MFLSRLTSTDVGAMDAFLGDILGTHLCEFEKAKLKSVLGTNFLIDQQKKIANNSVETSKQLLFFDNSLVTVSSITLLPPGRRTHFRII